ncbi:hypothetical protein NSA56_17110 [Oceanobacillus caeni]|uniref:hypothetical protein n=1 Tax=Oceanobacillus caeni TaxID=405946 RepID=UPI002149AE0A|nr:hypothetical protein [Oceanobacillus caeni]MCR1836058.1 hypothetical protein [Oceanobacillus caeni]
MSEKDLIENTETQASSEFDDDGIPNAKVRNLKGSFSTAISIVAIGMSIFHLYTAYLVYSNRFCNDPHILDLL